MLKNSVLSQSKLGFSPTSEGKETNQSADANNVEQVTEESKQDSFDFIEIDEVCEDPRRRRKDITGKKRTLTDYLNFKG